MSVFKRVGGTRSPSVRGGVPLGKSLVIVESPAKARRLQIPGPELRGQSFHGPRA